MKRIFLIVLLFPLFGVISVAQERNVSQKDSIPFYLMSLEELMNVEVSVASPIPMTNREAPGIVTIITQEEIRKSGANSLMDVLKMVPGFNFGVDVEGVVGISVRGNWANEGKVLMLWDGMEMNEDLFSTLQFGGRYPVDRINRIEIIRGPGSAMYGGNAEYAVINIITLENPENNGVYANAFNSAMSRTFAYRGVSLSAGKNFGKTHINLATNLNQSNRSQERYTDFTGKSYDMSNQSGVSNAQYRLDFSRAGFTLTGMYDSYALDQRDGYEEIYLRSYKTEFNMFHLSTKYDWKVNDRLTITPGVRMKFQRPWSYTKSVTDDIFEPYNTSVNKKEYYLNSNFNPVDKINLSGGLVYYHQIAIQNFDTVLFSNGKDKFNIDNYAVFVQSVVKTKPVNIILGFRYEHNPYFGCSVLPRIGLTRVWEKFHFKTLYSSAFRAPSVENINANTQILPEKTYVAEFEAGYKLSDESYVTANIYDITTDDPIIYYYDASEADNYKNESSMGTRGFEVEYKWKSRGVFASLNYSFYTTAGHSSVSIYSIKGRPEKLLAFPSHKINLNCNFQLSEKINVNPSIRFLSDRYSYSMESDGTEKFNEYSPAVYANLAINFENIFCKGFSIQAACLNILDEEQVYIQPYNGNHSPLPGTGREYKLQVSYSLSFKREK